MYINSKQALRIATALGLVLVGLLVFNFRFRTEDSVGDRQRDELELREGSGLCLKGQSRPFSGRLVEHYVDGSMKAAVEILKGRPHGISRGWYDNGQLEVEEHFVKGISHGTRTRWHQNGNKKSQAKIEDGVITGIFAQWHDTGQRAAEVMMKDGVPDGFGRAWHASGVLKSTVEMRAGEVVSSQSFEDTLPNKRSS